MDYSQLIQQLKSEADTFAPNSFAQSVLLDAAKAIQTLQAQLEQVKAERDEAVTDIERILLDIERARVDNCIDYELDEILSNICVQYCSDSGAMCFRDIGNGRCGNFKWRGASITGENEK